MLGKNPLAEVDALLKAGRVVLFPNGKEFRLEVPDFKTRMEGRKILRKGGCLLYTSPSPRD